jgi:hypothetical protein
MDPIDSHCVRPHCLSRVGELLDLDGEAYLETRREGLRRRESMTENTYSSCSFGADPDRG